MNDHRRSTVLPASSIVQERVFKDDHDSLNRVFTPNPNKYYVDGTCKWRKLSVRTNSHCAFPQKDNLLYRKSNRFVLLRFVPSCGLTTMSISPPIDDGMAASFARFRMIDRVLLLDG